MARDERAGVGPEVIDRHVQEFLQEIQAVEDLDEQGLADQVSQDAPRRLTPVVSRRRRSRASASATRSPSQPSASRTPGGIAAIVRRLAGRS